MITASDYAGTRFIAETQEDLDKLNFIVKACEGLIFGGYDGDAAPLEIEYINGQYQLDFFR